MSIATLVYKLINFKFSIFKYEEREVNNYEEKSLILKNMLVNQIESEAAIFEGIL
jgi:hypothetical protein